MVRLLVPFLLGLVLVASSAGQAQAQAARRGGGVVRTAPGGNAGGVHWAVFEGQTAARNWSLKELNPAMPADWSQAEFLTLEIKSDTAQRFNLRLFTGAGMRSVLFAPFEGAWCRVSVPLAPFKKAETTGFDLASVSNRSRPSSFINLGGIRVGPMDRVTTLGLMMSNPIGRTKVEIRAVQLTPDARDAVLEPKPLVDEFGQWIPADWPGKAKTLEDLKKAWAEEAAALQPGDFNTDQYGGFKNTTAKATGFFRVEQVDGKWWFVDPEGHLFFSQGSDGMGFGSGTPTAGRDGVFKQLPPAGAQMAVPGGVGARAGRRGAAQAGTSQTQGRGARARAGMGAGGGRGAMASFYTWNLTRRYGPDFQQPWIDMTMARMKAWGLNTLGNWSSPLLWDAHKAPYVVNLSGLVTRSGYMGLPDVYAPEFAQAVDEACATQCGPRKTDPWLLGYFIANEPPWPGREIQLTNMIQEGADCPIKAELTKALAAGDTPEARRAFIYRCFEKFLDVTCKAVKKYDPNHLNLGLRFGGSAPDEMIKLCKVFDVFSINSYGTQVNQQLVERGNRLTGLPVIIGEFHFGTPGRGLSAGLVQTADQAERGVAYRYYVENAAAIPALIGTHWFQWIDEPNTGRNDGENYNIGMLDVTDLPYPEMVKAVQETQKRLFEVHSGKTPPFSQRAKAQ